MVGNIEIILITIVIISLYGYYWLYERLSTNGNEYRYNGVYHNLKSIQKWFRKDDKKI